MAKIDIDIPHPLAAAITIVAALIAIVTVDHVTDAHAEVVPVGGNTPQEVVHEAEQDADLLRQQQALLMKREEILRYQLEMLREERRLRGPEISESVAAEIDRSEQMLVDLIRDQKEAEDKILLTLQQMWKADGRAMAISRKAGKGSRPIVIGWTVEPKEGISAGFADKHYEEVIGMRHEGMDIPTEQGTPVHAAADGIVEEVSDNGYGFNSVTIRHDGFATLYGHVESFLVEEGQQVHRGDEIALSGGRPGTKGAGHISTGPHVHFELIIEGERVDPLPYLQRSR